MKKNDIIKVKVLRYNITPETKENYYHRNEVPREYKTLDVVVDSVGTSTIKGHYLNDSDRKTYTVFDCYDIDRIGCLERLVVRVEIDKYGSVYEYKVDPRKEADYYECERLRSEARKAHLKQGTREWWSFMGRGILTVAEPSKLAWTGSKLSDGQLVG